MLSKVGAILVQRRRRWASIAPALIQYIIHLLCYWGATHRAWCSGLSTAVKAGDYWGGTLEIKVTDGLDYPGSSAVADTLR